MPQSDARSGEVLHVLHIEDNAADAMLMQEYIRDVVPTATFDLAVRLAQLTEERAAAADCALLDLSLPDASGLHALVALRALSERLPIIVLTGFDNLELGVTAVRDGADDYLIKNHVDGFTLERAITYAMERRQMLLELAEADGEPAAQAEFEEPQPQVVEDSRQLEASEVSAGDGGAASGSEVAVGTHEVAVRIDAGTGEYALRCLSCGWESHREPDQGHSWAARNLDLTLLRHVDFVRRGDEDSGDSASAVGTRRQAAKTPMAPPSASVRSLSPRSEPDRPDGAEPMAAGPAGSPRPAVSRRGMLRPRRWLEARAGSGSERPEDGS